MTKNLRRNARAVEKDGAGRESEIWRGIGSKARVISGIQSFKPREHNAGELPRQATQISRAGKTEGNPNFKMDGRG